jgi:hypothetical protein
MAQQHSVRGSAFLWGSIFGGLIVILDLVDRFVLGGVERLGPAAVAVLRRRHLALVHTPNPGYILLVEGIVLLVTILLFFLAGALAARRAYAVEAGIGAGVIAGAIVAVVHMVIVLIAILRAAHPTVGADIVRGVVTAILALLVGIGMGALGGLAGRGPRPNSSAAIPPYTPPAPAVMGYTAMPPASTPIEGPADYTYTPTPSYVGPENNYPTAPLNTPSQY